MSKFIKPTIEQIKEYANEVFPQLDADRFYDHYNACGWVVGRNKPMKDWKAAVRLWKRNYETDFGRRAHIVKSDTNWRERYENKKICNQAPA